MTPGTTLSTARTTSGTSLALMQTRPKIALVVDTFDWAFYNIATQIKKKLNCKYDFDIIPHTYYNSFFELLAVFIKYDYVHIFWREVLQAFRTEYNSSYANQIGWDLNEIIARFYSRPVTSSVYDHLFLSDPEIRQRAPIFSEITGYTVSSNRLWNIYNNIRDFPKPDCVFTDGVDLRHFRPANLERFENLGQRPIVIGWVGNSAWASELGDPKGVNTILRPAINCSPSAPMAQIQG